ncbi:GNAT family N-acetyltransferase [Rhizobium sp. TH2]|uniref:GNAT family N-acetyltransferase n=1 Tax=Rhizobium sp. TH2 TaxID=2775403 RepID=UPI002157715D|nr:GNAT family N-acetyltransferase [Rhizobium sp. TH2]UVC06965.1 GNAT family N-acetyltransferase [Rhizobium sp. TH2]
MSDLLVRAIKQADAADIAAIYTFESVIANTGQIPLRDGQFWANFWKAKDPNGVELVCEIEGRAVGHLGIITSASHRRKHVASFGIAVHPDFQGRGVGNALISEMLKLSDNWLNIVRMELTVASDNQRAMRLYLKHGFVVEGEARFDNFRAGQFTHSTQMARINPAFADTVAA